VIVVVVGGWWWWWWWWEVGEVEFGCDIGMADGWWELG